MHFNVTHSSYNRYRSPNAPVITIRNRVKSKTELLFGMNGLDLVIVYNKIP